MRGLLFLSLMAALLPLAIMRPFVGVLLWCWISFSSPHREFWGPVAGLPWAATAFVVTMMGIVLARDAGRVAPNAAFWLVVAFIGCTTLTSFAALAPPAAVWSKWEEVTKICLGLLLTAALISDRERVHALIWVICLSIGYFGVKGGIFTLLNGGSYRVFGPEFSMIADNNHLAVALLVIAPLINYLRLQSRHQVVRWGLLGAMILVTLAALGSHSRGALIALAAGALVFWLRSSRRIIMGVALVAGLGAGIAFMPDHWTARMETINTYEEDASAMSRLSLWRMAWDLAVMRPLVGVGYRGTYTREVVDLVNPDSQARAIHSIWFELLAEHGFPTFFLWVGLFCLGGWYAWRLPRLTRDRPDLFWARDLGLMAQVSFVVYAAGGSFLSLSYWDVIWTLVLIVAATHVLVRKALQASHGQTPAPIPEALASRRFAVPMGVADSSPRGMRS